jgi:hypothetical protein
VELFVGEWSLLTCSYDSGMHRLGRTPVLCHTTGGALKREKVIFFWTAEDFFMLFLSHDNFLAE